MGKFPKKNADIVDQKNKNIMCRVEIVNLYNLSIEKITRTIVSHKPDFLYLFRKTGENSIQNQKIIELLQKEFKMTENDTIFYSDLDFDNLILQLGNVLVRHKSDQIFINIQTEPLFSTAITILSSLYTLKIYYFNNQFDEKNILNFVSNTNSGLPSEFLVRFLHRLNFLIEKKKKEKHPEEQKFTRKECILVAASFDKRFPKTMSAIKSIHYNQIKENYLQKLEKLGFIYQKREYIGLNIEKKILIQILAQYFNIR